MNKSEIRTYMKHMKEELTSLDIERCSRAAVERVIQSDVFIKAEAIYIYMEYNQEIITHPIMTRAWQMGKRVAIPKVIDRKMDFYYIKSFDDVIPGYRGILEPMFPVKAEEEQALVIMPGLAFDQKFNRIGYGGGFYDGFIATHRDAEYIKLGLCYDFQIVDRIETEEHDHPVDMLITPKAFYSTGRSFTIKKHDRER